jgi:hypothetical protein
LCIEALSATFYTITIKLSKKFDFSKTIVSVVHQSTSGYIFPPHRLSRRKISSHPHFIKPKFIIAPFTTFLKMASSTSSHSTESYKARDASTQSTKSYDFEARDASIENEWDDLSDMMSELQRESKREALRQAARDERENLQREMRGKEKQEARVREERYREVIEQGKGVVRRSEKRREQWGFGMAQPLGFWL